MLLKGLWRRNTALAFEKYLNINIYHFVNNFDPPASRTKNVIFSAEVQMFFTLNSHIVANYKIH
jgi:hypothetical protein